MRAVLALCLFVPAKAAAEDVTLTDCSRIFQGHASEVRQGIDRNGPPADVLEIAGSGAIWPTGSGTDLSCEDMGSDPCMCSLQWLSSAAAAGRHCNRAGVSGQADMCLAKVDRIAAYVGQSAVPPRDLVFMRRAMTPEVGVIAPEACQKDDEISTVLDLFENREVWDFWAGFVVSPPHLLLMSRCV